MRVAHLIALDRVDRIDREVRLRKILQWQKHRGLEDVGVFAGFDSYHRPAVCWHGGSVDGYPLFSLNRDLASRARDAVLGLKPDVVHVQELDALWLLLARWTDEAVDNARSGASFPEMGVDIVKPGCRIIYEAQEYEPGRLLPPGIDRSDWLWMDRTLVPLADDVITVSPAIVDRMSEEHGRPPHLVPNSFSRTRVPKKNTDIRKAVGARRTDRVVVFSGNVSSCRGLGTLVEAIKLLSPGWKLAILGSADHADGATRSKLSEVGATMLGYQPYPYLGAPGRSLVDWIAGADVGVNLVDQRCENYRLSLPNKLFEYAFSGVPVVSNYAKDVVDLTREYDLGGIAYVSGHVESEAHVLAEAIYEAAGVRPQTERFIGDWCWEVTGGAAIDKLYDLGNR